MICVTGYDVHKVYFEKGKQASFIQLYSKLRIRKFGFQVKPLNLQDLVSGGSYSYQTEQPITFQQLLVANTTELALALHRKIQVQRETMR